MRIQDLGSEIRKARQTRGMTQAELASASGISRPTLSLLESGLVPDLGVRKVLAVLDRLGLDLAWRARGLKRRPDFVRMASATASVSFKDALTEDELIRALVTGKVPAHRRPHLRSLFEEAPAPLLRGLVEAAAHWTKPDKLRRNLHRLVHELSIARKVDEWLKIG